MRNENKYIFRCKTTDAYIFKILIELLHNIIKTACFEITPQKIGLRMMDSNRRTLVDINLKSENFNFYYFSENIEGQSLNIGLNLNHFYKMLKSIKKRDQLVLFIEEDKCADLGIEIIPKDFSRLTISYVKIQNIQNLEIALPERYERSILVMSNEFSKMCKDLFNMSNTISILAKKYTIEFICNVGSVYSRQVILGDTESQKFEPSSLDEFKEDYDTEQLSRVLKISGLYNNINIQCAPDMPLLLSSKIGILGEILIFLKSKKQLDTEVN